METLQITYSLRSKCNFQKYAKGRKPREGEENKEHHQSLGGRISDCYLLTINR